MEDQLYGRIAFERFIHEPLQMNNLQKVQQKLEPRFCRVHFLEFKELSDHRGLKLLLDFEPQYESMKMAFEPRGIYHTFDEDEWVRFQVYLDQQGGDLALYCREWMPWAIDVYRSCTDCKDVTDESRSVIRYKTLRDEIKNRFRCSGSLYCAAFNTHFPGRYYGFVERSANIEEMSFIWSFVKRGGANIFGLPSVDIPFSADECILCKRMRTVWRGRTVNCKAGWFAGSVPREAPTEEKKRKRSNH